MKINNELLEEAVLLKEDMNRFIREFSDLPRRSGIISYDELKTTFFLLKISELQKQLNNAILL